MLGSAPRSSRNRIVFIFPTLTANVKTVSPGMASGALMSPPADKNASSAGRSPFKTAPQISGVRLMAALLHAANFTAGKCASSIFAKKKQRLLFINFHLSSRRTRRRRESPELGKRRRFPRKPPPRGVAIEALYRVGSARRLVRGGRRDRRGARARVGCMGKRGMRRRPTRRGTGRASSSGPPARRGRGRARPSTPRPRRRRRARRRRPCGSRAASPSSTP